MGGWKRTLDLLVSGIRDGCKLTCGCWDSILDPLQKQALLSAELSPVNLFLPNRGLGHNPVVSDQNKALSSILGPVGAEKKITERTLYSRMLTVTQ